MHIAIYKASNTGTNSPRTYRQGEEVKGLSVFHTRKFYLFLVIVVLYSSFGIFFIRYPFNFFPFVFIIISRVMTNVRDAAVHSPSTLT